MKGGYAEREREKTATLSIYETELHSLRNDHSSQKVLIEKLEADLTRASRPVAVVPALQADDIELSTLDMLQTAIGEGESGRMKREERNERDASYVAIVVAQRDRLKQKLDLLEQERSDDRARASTLQAEIDKIREDNVKLYGKIKFLQSYGNKKGEVSVSVDAEGNYKEQYENRIDPFRKFNQQETHRRVNNMQLHDRASLSIGRAIMTSSSARLTFFFYLLVLHLLVFLVLYRFAYVEACEHDFQQDCVEKFKSHMLEHHHK